MKPSGRIVPSRRYRSAPKSNQSNSSASPRRAERRSSIRTPARATSGPIPSPGITAMRLAMGLLARLLPLYFVRLLSERGPRLLRKLRDRLLARCRAGSLLDVLSRRRRLLRARHAASLAGLLLPYDGRRQLSGGGRGRSTFESPSVTNQPLPSRTWEPPSSPQTRSRRPLPRRKNPRRRSMPVETGFVCRQYTAATPASRNTSRQAAKSASASRGEQR